jgi:hypothetical protein
MLELFVGHHTLYIDRRILATVQRTLRAEKFPDVGVRGG